MTKDAIIHDLREIGKTNSVSSYKRMVCEMAADTIENQAKALDALTLANMALKEKCRWISVEERKPVYGERVLVSGIENRDEFVTLVNWNERENLHCKIAQYWMPMPEGPEEGE